MELKDYIEAGIKRKNSVSGLAAYLGIHANNVSAAKAHARGLSSEACVKLSDLLGVDLKTIIAASELATERKEEKRAFWLPFVTNAQNLGKAASYALILGIVLNFVTTNQAEASNSAKSAQNQFVLCKVLAMRFNC